MLSKATLTALELVREFYVNIYELEEGYFLTWLRVHPIRVDLNLISAITHNLNMPNSLFPWSLDDAPPHIALMEYFPKE